MKFLFDKSKKEGQISDYDLVLKFRNSHDNAYVGELFQRYTHLVFGVAMKYLKNEDDCKDMVMEIFEYLITALKKHAIKNFKGWLFTVTKNHCLMKLRKENVETKHEEEFRKIEAELVENPLVKHLNNEENTESLVSNLQSAMVSLKNEQKKCIELFYLEEKCYQEITEITGYSLKQVKSYLQNGKRNLKNYLLKKDG